MASFALLEIINGFRKLLCPRDKWYLLGLVILLCIGAAMEIAGLGLLLPLVAAFTKPELLEQNTLFCFRCYRTSHPPHRDSRQRRSQTNPEYHRQ